MREIVLRLSARSAARITLCLLWSVGIFFGLYKATQYATSFAEVLPQPRRWPAGTSVRLAPDRATLLLTLHPRCVCSRASLEELARLLAQTPAPLNVQILVYQPAKEPAAAARTDVTEQARSLPGVAVIPDPGGAESTRFNMSVSGHTAVYAPDGRLLFSGGITPARGHTGDNAGREAILAALSGRKSPTASTPVFGCSIRSQT